MKPTLDALGAAQTQLAEARAFLALAHSIACKDGSGLAEMVTIDLLGAARKLETDLERVREAFRHTA